MTVGQFIRARRIVVRLSQRQLGEACGFKGHTAVTAVQQWENDKAMPKTKHLRRLAQALKVPLDSPLIP